VNCSTIKCAQDAYNMSRNRTKAITMAYSAWIKAFCIPHIDQQLQDIIFLTHLRHENTGCLLVYLKNNGSFLKKTNLL
jgi:hypothetical protein